MRSVRRSNARKRALFAAFAILLTLIAAACEKHDEPTGPPEPPAVPVTITHAYGTTTLVGTPERVVALGNQWLDTAQALGVIPIAYLNDLATPAVPPWEPAALPSAKALDTTKPLVDQLTPLHPDLILADPFIADAATYADLAKIAPTLPALAAAPTTPWPDLTRALGKALRKSIPAENLIADLTSRTTALTTAHPTLKSKTFTTTWLSAPTQLLALTAPDDPANTLLSQLGLTIPAPLIAQGRPTGRLPLPPDHLSDLTSDLLIAAYSPGMAETYRALPGFPDLPAVKKNATLFLTTEELAALQYPTALSLPHLLTKLEPALANAAR
ncbi:ABC transporter substrate-binding protein [Nocardia sp. NPDC058058]|uniref:ABC transporter substrate-binding protein n=1 Tax=Nocardia sp. NPDC058058 TaxID=3346317 RepID=UPI0036D87066